MPTQQDMNRAAYGYLTEIEQWMMMLIHFLEAKLKHDPDYQVLADLIRMLHLDLARSRVPASKVFELIAHNRRPSNAGENTEAGVDYKTDEQLQAMPHADLARYAMHLQIKYDEEAGGHASSSESYRDLWYRAWAVCQEQATLVPTQALLDLLRTVQCHLGTVPPTCGCDACDLERRIVAALERPQDRLEGYQATIAACRAALAGIGAPTVHSERLDEVAGLVRWLSGPRLIVLRGLPGSGKSTWARAYLGQHPEAVRINRDDLREMLYGDRLWSAIDEAVTVRARDALIVQALLAGRTVILDDTNLRDHHIQAAEALARPLGVPVEIVVMEASIEECIARDAQRPQPVGERRIRELAGEIKDRS